MSITLHNLKARKLKKRKRVGRGNSSGHGTYSTRGMKGQRSRSGGKSGLKLKGFKANLQNLPKLRGFNSPKQELQEVTLAKLEKNFNDGEQVTPEILYKKNLIAKKTIGVKIIGNESLTKKLTISGCKLSAGAEELVIKAGGKLLAEEIQPKTEVKKGKKAAKEEKPADNDSKKDKK